MPAVQRASLFFEDHYDQHDTRRNAFVGVAISGGGSRAAVFGAEVISALSGLGFLDHVAAISSVSGGSLPAAYYALSRRDPTRWPLSTMTTALAADLRRDLMADVRRPSTLMNLFSTTYNRTDLLADVLDRRLFSGARWSDLDGKSAGTGPVPHLLVNASIAGSNQGFLFSDDVFGALGSELTTFRISHAVAASAAFPGLLDQVALRDYSGDFGFNADDVIDPRGFDKRLSECTDSLCAYLRTKLQGGRVWTPRHENSVDQRREELASTLNWILGEFESWEDLWTDDKLAAAGLSEQEKVRIAVAKGFDRSGPRRGAVRNLITKAFRDQLKPLPPMYVHLYDGGPSDNLGWGTITSAAYAYVDYAPKTAPASGCFVFLIDAHPERVADSQAFTREHRRGLSYLIDFESITDATSTLLDQQREQILKDMHADEGEGPLETWPIFDEGTPRPSGVQTCLVWRFSFDRLIRTFLRHRPRGVTEGDRWEREHAGERKAHETLAAVLNATATDFRLTGPQNCSQPVLHKALRDAAQILVQEDEGAASAARRWFEEHFGAMPTRGSPPPLYADWRWAKVRSSPGDHTVQSVACTGR